MMTLKRSSDTTLWVFHGWAPGEIWSVLKSGYALIKLHSMSTATRAKAGSLMCNGRRMT